MFALFTKPPDHGGIGWTPESFNNSTISQTIAVLASFDEKKEGKNSDLEATYKEWEKKNFPDESH